MLVIHNNHKPAHLRIVHCTVCVSELGVSPADIQLVGGVQKVKCPCCAQIFTLPPATDAHRPTPAA